MHCCFNGDFSFHPPASSWRAYRYYLACGRQCKSGSTKSRKLLREKKTSIFSTSLNFFLWSSLQYSRWILSTLDGIKSIPKCRQHTHFSWHVKFGSVKMCRKEEREVEHKRKIGHWSFGYCLENGSSFNIRKVRILGNCCYCCAMMMENCQLLSKCKNVQRSYCLSGLKKKKRS